MKKYIYLSLVILVLISCKSNHRVVTSKSPSINRTSKSHKSTKPIPTYSGKTEEAASVESVSETTNKIIRKALSFKGTKYKYGGTSKSGMDCSGLMYTSFKSANLVLPRTSIDQSKKGSRISQSKAQKGDLVFFKTGGSGRINHVGLVVSVDDREVKFVHSSSSRGVMISSLKEGYWSNAFSQVRRIYSSGAMNSSIPTPVVSPKDNSYVVKKGDTLYAIARKYTGVSASNIMKHNKLGSTRLSPGMVLKIPKGM